MARIFIAISLPNEIKEELEDIKQNLVNSFPDGVGLAVGKWVKKENLHITMLFIGDADENRIVEVSQKIKEAIEGQVSFKIKINRVGLGAKEKGIPRLIWAEVGESKELESIAKKLGSPNFKAHITLARIKAWQWKQIDPEEMPNVEQDLDIEFETKSIDIMESKLKRTGAEYSLLESIIFI